jgi:hypothetical protein
VKHATRETLQSVVPLLDEIRAAGELRERSFGTFYRKGSAFLHFHEDPAGLFADVKSNGAWQRLRVNSRAEQSRVRRLVTAELKNLSAADHR